ncbi:MAG TPA: hypothetical protein VEH52_09020 [Gaiellaceae bacterium]|jgi:hypothetical protein|nr:hypothetical protein [Gaiellaceae bacterium]
MKTFGVLLAALAVAALLYAATAIGGSTASPSSAQFNALKKTVAAMKKKQKADEKNINDIIAVIGVCFANAVPVTRISGYVHENADGTTSNITALDVADSISGGQAQAYFLDVGATCANAINQTGSAFKLKLHTFRAATH